MKTSPLFLAALAACAAGCTHVTDMQQAQSDFYNGVEAEGADELTLARNEFSSAYGTAVKANFDPAFQARCLYELARVTGFSGSYAESEKDFKRVLVLIDLANGRANSMRAPALSEYARLLHDTGRHADAVAVYEKAIPELQKQGTNDVDPLGYALLLEDYSESLAGAGFPRQARAVDAEAAALKEKHKGEKPYFEVRRYRSGPE
jgi:tetratricopeptide (TPR) repeat protein